MKKLLLWIVVLMLTVSVVATFSLVGCKAVPEAVEAEKPVVEEAPAEEEEVAGSWWAQAAAPYKDVTIKGISESTPPSKYMQEVLAKSFMEETGINVEFEVTSWDEMYDKEIKDMEVGTGIYDFVYIEQDIIFSYLHNEYLLDMTNFMNENPELVFDDLDMDDFTSFINDFKDDEGHVYGLPFEAFLKICLYRKDLFENKEIQDAFKGEYGWDLRPAVTFDEYGQIAKFFTEWGKDNDMELWGTTVQAASHPSSFYEIFETILPPAGVYNWGINMENWKATSADGGAMDSDKAKEALAFWVSMLDYAPPEATSSTWDEVAASFAAGRAAQGWVYGENAAWIATNAEKSVVVGNVGVARPPLMEGVLEEAEAGEGYIGYYDGGALGIPHCSKNPEAAMLFIQWVCRKDFQGEFAKAGSRIVRTSTFDDPIVLAMDKEVDGYYSMFKNEGYLYKGAPPFPFHATIREVIYTYTIQAITGEMTASEALDAAAKATNEELVKLGYGK